MADDVTFGRCSFTVALCTHNHADRLRKTLADLRQMQQPNAAWELLIVDNGCTDGTQELLRQDGWRKPGWIVRIVREGKLGLSHARNRAIKEARGEYIVFMDDDETPDLYWLCAFEEAANAWHPDAMGGRIEVLFEEGERPGWLKDELLGFLGKLDHGGKARRLDDPKTPIYGGNFGFRKEVFEKIGDFDSSLGRKGDDNTGGEDTEIYCRLLEHGCHIRWVPEAVIYHRIQAGKLRRGYFLDLHFRQGKMEGARKRGDQSGIPPAYLFPQLWRAVLSVLRQWSREGRNATLRKEMNVVYFLGYLIGWREGVPQG